MSIGGTLAVAISGLNANAFRAGVAANNIVNQHTPGFRAGEARTTSVVTQGSTAGGVQVQLLEGDAVDLAGEFARLIQAETAYRANAEVVRRAEDIARATVDIIA